MAGRWAFVVFTAKLSATNLTVQNISTKYNLFADSENTDKGLKKHTNLRAWWAIPITAAAFTRMASTVS